MNYRCYQITLQWIIFTQIGSVAKRWLGTYHWGRRPGGDWANKKISLILTYFNYERASQKTETPGKFWKVVLEKDGEDQLVRSCEKWRCVNEQRNILHELRKRKANWIGHILRRNCLLQQVIEGKLKGQIEVTRRRGRRCKKLLDDLKDRRGYCQLKEEALDRTMWRNRFGRGFGPVVWQITDDDDDDDPPPKKNAWK